MAKTAFSVGDIVLSRYLRHLSVICRHKYVGLKLILCLNRRIVLKTSITSGR